MGRNITMYEEYELLKREVKRLKEENRQLKADNEVAHKIINSYYEEGKHDVNKYITEQKQLSDNAKRFVHDIERGLENE